MLRFISSDECESLVIFLKKELTNPQSLKFLHEIQDLGPKIFEERSWFSNSDKWDGRFVCLRCVINFLIDVGL